MTDRWKRRLLPATKITDVIEASPGPKAPFASVMSGSIVVHTTWGFTRWHALGRGVKWARAHGAGVLTIRRWADGPTQPEGRYEPK